MNRICLIIFCLSLMVNGCSVKVGYSKANGDNRCCFPCIDIGDTKGITIGLFGYDDSWRALLYERNF